jgi:hypothetical protein
MKYKIINLGSVYSSYIKAYNHALGYPYTNEELEFLRKRRTYESVCVTDFHRKKHWRHGDIVELVSTFGVMDFDPCGSESKRMNSGVIFAHVRYLDGKNLIIGYDGLEKVTAFNFRKNRVIRSYSRLKLKGVVRNDLKI